MSERVLSFPRATAPKSSPPVTHAKTTMEKRMIRDSIWNKKTLEPKIDARYAARFVENPNFFAGKTA
jgi:hypothetical protein